MGNKKSPPKKKPAGTNRSMVKQKNVVWLSVVLVFIGFIGGTIFSSFKLGSSPGGANQTSVSPPATNFQSLEAQAFENPESAAVWTRLGNEYFDSNQYQKAIDAYEKSVAIEPGNPNVLTDLGVMYRRNKQPEKAVEMFSKAIAADSKHEFSRMNKGIVLLHDLNDKKGAITAWEGLLAINPLATFGDGKSVDGLIWKYKQENEN